MQAPSWALKIHQVLLKTESFILICLLLSMVVLAVAQIVLRNFFDIGLLWAQAYTRIAVLWLTLLGAMLATRKNEHIAIDVLVHRLPSKWQQRLESLTALFSSAICGLMTYHSVLFIHFEYQDGNIAFVNIPVWFCEAVIPFAFAIIACRYLLIAVLNLFPKASC